MDNNNTHIEQNSKAQYIDWLRGQGEKPDESVIEHVAECYECKEEILELSDILDKEDVTIHKRQPTKLSTKLIMRFAAVLIGVIVVVLAIEFLRPDENVIHIVSDDTDSVQVTSRDSLNNAEDLKIHEENNNPVVTIVQHDTIKFADNFAPNKGLEILINAQFRSNTIVDESKKGQQLAVYYIGDTFNFGFSLYENHNVVLTIVDHSGESIDQLTPEDDSNAVVLDWEPGLYYWKLSTSDELLDLGKFRLYSKNN